MTFLRAHLILILDIYLIQGDDYLKLTINKDFNETYGVLSTLLIFANYDYFKVQVEEKWNMKFEIYRDKSLKEISESSIFNDAKYFLDMELQIKDVFVNPELIRDCKDLDEYLLYLRNKEEDELKIEIYKALEFDDFVYDKEITPNQLIEKIDELDCNSEAKWFFLSLLKDPRLYIEKFIKLIESYLPLYDEIKESFLKEYEEFVKWIDEELAIHGVDFIANHLEFLNLKQYTEVHLYYSLFDLVSSYSHSDGSIHIFVGIMFKEYFEDRKDKQDIDKHLIIYKVLSDRTRYEIIKLLVEQESYGQEIAKKLGITTATVSYHMDYLMGASLIITKRQSRRLYYSINKDQIKQSISFLEKELNL